MSRSILLVVVLSMISKGIESRCLMYLHSNTIAMAINIMST